MFWRFGGYANISNLNTILDKPDVTLEEVLDEADLIQELKGSNSKLIEFLRDENVLRKLLDYVVAPEAPRPEGEDDAESSDEEEVHEKSLSPFRRGKDKKERSKRKEKLEEWEKHDKTRTKLAYTSCEILSSETWSIIDSMMENQQYLESFWSFVRREPPLDPTEAGYFTKINETLLDRKTEDMIAFLQSLNDIIPAILNHIECAAVMDLLLKIISMEKSEGGYRVVDWLQTQDLIPRLLAFLEHEQSPATQTAAGDFLKAIVTISANASQNEQSCIGPNNLTRQLVSKPCMDRLLTNMLRGGNPLTVGVGLVIEIIRKNNSDYDPDVGAAPDSMPSSNDPIYLGTMLRSFADKVPDFMALLSRGTQAGTEGDDHVNVKRRSMGVAFGKRIEPLGFDRFKTCELMAELLHCSNMGLLNERGSEAFIMQRDEERERLRSEGRLQTLRVPDSAVTEFSEGSTHFTNGISPINRSSTPEEGRRLGVANHVSEEDGFEDVGHPADDVDEIKDEFDEKTAFEIESEPVAAPDLLNSNRPRLDLDEEFEDEPLTSPRLEAIDEGDMEVPEDAIPEPLHPHSTTSPTSPTSNLASGVGNLAVEEDIAMANHDISSGEFTRSPEPMKDTFAAAGADTAPPLPKRDQPLSTLTPSESSPHILSPHPEDKPAPLFADDSKDSTSPEEKDEIHDQAPGNTSFESVDTVQGMEGDSNRSLNTSGNEQSFVPHFEFDIDGRPIVGDFLKIMFVEHQVVPTILDFFFRFPWNNFLHNVVYDVVQQVFNGPMDRGYNRQLAIDLFQTGQITERIIHGQQQSDEVERATSMRLGYMGHLTLVAEEVVKFSDRHPPEMLSQSVLDKVTSQSWNEYVETTLSETRERDNAILGGVRPDMSLGPRQAVLNAVNAAGGNFAGGASSALANAGLNGNPGLESIDLASNGSGTSHGSFGLSSGALMSGFGSSSDEEDEEMEELDDVEGGAGHSNQTPSSLESGSAPPNDPPPAPPPLNLPPSRARRQLAARLALHSQQKAEAAGISSDQGPDAIDADDTEQTDGHKDGMHSLTTDLEHDVAQDSSPEAAKLDESPHSSIVRDEEQRKPSGRHLDLDDFANSPAADADDTANMESGEDVEMRVALG